MTRKRERRPDETVDLSTCRIARQGGRIHIVVAGAWTSTIACGEVLRQETEVELGETAPRASCCVACLDARAKGGIG